MDPGHVGFVAMSVFWRSIMDEVRKGQIAYLFLKNRVSDGGIRLSRDFKRELGNVAKTVGITLEEATEFTEIMVREVVDEIFAKKPDTSDESAKDEGSAKDTPPDDKSTSS